MAAHGLRLPQGGSQSCTWASFFPPSSRVTRFDESALDALRADADVQFICGDAMLTNVSEAMVVYIDNEALLRNASRCSGSRRIRQLPRPKASDLVATVETSSFL